MGARYRAEDYTVERVLAIRAFRDGFKWAVNGNTRKRHTLDATTHQHWLAGVAAGQRAISEAEDAYKAKLLEPAPAPLSLATIPLCGKYLGDNDGTCPQLTCVRPKGHYGDCDNVRGDE